jgi:HK97 family phage prohead protease
MNARKCPPLVYHNAMQQNETRAILGTSPSATGRTVTGYAATFGKRSQNLGTKENPWHEILQIGCFPDLKTQDCRCLVNHDPSQILARSKYGKGSLRLSIDNIGLRYQFTAPTTQAGNDILESIKRGDIDQSSFGFTIASGGDKWTKDGNGQLRTITRIESLQDVSPCTFPAYTDSTVSARHKGNATPRKIIQKWSPILGLYNIEG